MMTEPKPTKELWQKYFGKVIPIDLCLYSLRARKVNQLKVYLVLKYFGDGYYYPSSENDRHLLKILGITKTTFKKHLQDLSVDNWIRKCETRNSYWIRGYRQLIIMERFNSPLGVKLKMDDFRHFRAFLIAGVISKLIRDLRRRDWVSVRYNRRRTIIKALPPSTYLLANNYLAKVLVVSKSTACGYKAMAEKAKYIKTQENVSLLNIPVTQIDNYHEMTLTPRNRMVLRRKVVCYQEPDIIESKIKLLSRRRLKNPNRYLEG